MYKLYVHLFAAVVIFGLGGFFFWQYGQKQYHAGYGKCMYDGAVLATEAGEALKNEMAKQYKHDDVINRMRDAGWLRVESDR